MGRPAARELLDASFAQFQADRGVAGLLAQIRRNEDTLRQYAKEMSCHLGDFAEYAALRRQLSEREADLARAGARARRGAVTASLEALRRGDVIRVPRGRRAGLAVVLDPGVHPRDDPRPLVVTEARWSGRLSPVDFPAAVDVLGDGAGAQARQPPLAAGAPRPRGRACARSTCRRAGPEAAGRRPARTRTSELVRVRRALRAHPCHQCADREQHARWAERHSRLARENDALRGRIEGRTGSLGRTFDRICALLDDRGYLSRRRDDPGRSAAGPDLVRVRPARGRVPARRRVGRAGPGRTGGGRLDPRVRAAPRRDARRRDAHAGAARRVHRHRADLGRAQPPTRPSAGCRSVASRNPASSGRCTGGRGRTGWTGCSPPPASRGTELSAGDFIRWCKQALDLLDQLATAPDAGTGTIARGRGGAGGIGRGAPRGRRPEHAAMRDHSG